MKYCQNCGNAMNDADERCGRCGMRADVAVEPTIASGVSDKKPIDIILYGMLTFIFFAVSLSLIVMAIKGKLQIFRRRCFNRRILLVLNLE